MTLEGATRRSAREGRHHEGAAHHRARAAGRHRRRARRTAAGWRPERRPGGCRRRRRPHGGAPPPDDRRATTRHRLRAGAHPRRGRPSPRRRRAGVPAEPGDSGLQVRALQHRLFQLAWLPELTHRPVRRRDPRGRGRLPGQARPQGDRRGRPAHLAAADGDDGQADPRPAVQHPPAGPGAARGGRDRRRGPRRAGPAQADRVAVRRRHRYLRRRHGRGRARLPGQAGDPGDRRHRPADARPAARDDHDAVVRGEAQHRARAGRARRALPHRARAVRRQDRRARCGG